MLMKRIDMEIVMPFPTLKISRVSVIRNAQTRKRLEKVNVSSWLSKYHGICARKHDHLLRFMHFEQAQTLINSIKNFSNGQGKIQKIKAGFIYTFRNFYRNRTTSVVVKPRAIKKQQFFLFFSSHCHIKALCLSFLKLSF